MPQTPNRRDATPDAVPPTRRLWTAPVVEQLPALQDLTLQSVIPGGYGGFSWLDATDTTRRLG